MIQAVILVWKPGINIPISYCYSCSTDVQLHLICLEATPGEGAGCVQFKLLHFTSRKAEKEITEIAEQQRSAWWSSVRQPAAEAREGVDPDAKAEDSALSQMDTCPCESQLTDRHSLAPADGPEPLPHIGETAFSAAVIAREPVAGATGHLAHDQRVRDERAAGSNPSTQTSITRFASVTAQDQKAGEQRRTTAAALLEKRASGTPEAPPMAGDSAHRQDRPV